MFLKENVFVLFACLISFLAFSQENITYQKPPKEILDLADYERAPQVIMDSKKENMIFLYRNTYKTLDELNQEELRLGGLRINPVTNISSTMTYINNIKIRKVAEKVEKQVSGMPENAKISYLSWSPNDKKMAFANTTQNGVELWVIDINTALATKLTDAKINANLGNPFTWYADSENILVRMLPANRPAIIDSKTNLPTGPIVTVSDGSKAQNRTYQDLLKNKTDEANFENITTSELYKIAMDAKAELVKEKAMYAGESFSPDGNYLLITTLEKPFSYLVPLNRFPQKQQVFDNKGNLVKLVNDIPLSEVLPKGFMAVRKGKREMGWRSDSPASLYYVEALDEGDPEKKVEFRDELFSWDAPFDKNAVSLMKTINRFDYMTWGDANNAIVYDEWYDTRNMKTYLLNPSKTGEAPKILDDRNSQDIYSDPGKFETTKNQYGRSVLAINGDNMYLIGDGFTKDGQFPFVDEFSISTQKKKRLYQSAFTDRMETIFSFVDLKKGDVLVQIQSKSDYPNYYIRNVKTGNKFVQITSFKNPFESIKNVHKEVIKYTRKDGVELSGTLYLPVGYDKKKKEKMPLLIWAYPREFKDKSSASQSGKNPNQFTFPYYGSFVYWVTRGYVVLDDASFPIVGEGKNEPNDTFIEQLVGNAEAAIDAVEALGYIDRSRVAVGGHSYGAFMTANLLTHSTLFACGIARSGAYNRTLTPFGFQSEQRNYWEAMNVYSEMSPFTTADKMKTPMLLVHGEADNNPGTFTLQTERYFQALKGLGAPARMVILPKESHSYVAKENILHLLWEQDQFLEKYLKK
jgi:dipeptidyl aminopeptidase/acylaminoacyl peptidase